MENEIKFTYDAVSAPAILACLRAVCRNDKQFQTNIINSIYFDTRNHILVMEKASSDYLKTKVRIRWYEGVGSAVNGSNCFLEFKWKVGSKRLKRRTPLDMNSSGLLRVLTDPAFLGEIRQHIMSNIPDFAGFDFVPRVLVSYTRHRFHEPFSETRIASDTGIQAKQIGPPVEGGGGRIFLDTSVLEVKGTHNELPNVLKTVLGRQVRKTAFSKYYECYKALHNYHQ